MLTLKRLLAFSVLLMGFVQSAYAVQASPYSTSTFTTNSENERIIPVLTVLNSPSVQFEISDEINNIETDLAEGTIEFRVCNEQQTCASTIDSVPTSVPLSSGTVTIIDGNIIYAPINPDSTDSVTFDYQVEVQSAESFDSSQITINVSSTSIQRDNMARVADAIESICTGSSTANATVQRACAAYQELDPDEVLDALATISPEEVVAEFTSTVNMSKEQTGNLSNRLNALRGGATGFSIAGLTYYNGSDALPGQWLHEMANQVGGNAGAEDNFSRLGFFINGSITDGEKDTTDLERGYDLEGDSITLGADYRFSDTLIAGVAYGISNSEIEFETDNTMDNDADNLLVYGTWYKDNFYIDGVFGYANGDIETKRNIVVGSIDESVSGETESSQLFFNVTGNYDFIDGPFTYGPYASLDIIDGEIDGYEEVGTTGFEVGFDDQDIESQVLTFGGRASYAWSQPWGIVTPHARVEWKNELEDDRSAIVGRFVLDTSNTTFEIEADDLDSSWFQMGLGVSATFQGGLSAYIDYEQVISYDDTDIETFSFGGRYEAKF